MKENLENFLASLHAHFLAHDSGDYKHYGGIAVDMGEKFARVSKLRPNETAGSCYCFVALVDNETKGLGKVSAGDILKPAGFKAPAKGKRGNVSDENNGLDGCGPYGVVYLNFASSPWNFV